SCYLLQQGNFVADALVYYGENTNVTRVFSEALPEIPGYEFDFVNSTALIEAVTAIDGRMVTPGGGSYSVLVLDESAREMTLPVLKKIKQLVDAGVAVTGTKPERTPTLSDDADEFSSLVDEIWSTENVSDDPADEVLKSNGVAEDVLISGNSAEILYVHRSTPSWEIYWLDNRSVDPNSAEISFRVSGRAPTLWHPQTGETKPVSWKIENGRTIITSTFESWEAYFIVFGERTTETSFELPAVTEETIGTVSGPWQVTFQGNRGAPESATFESLTSWSENDDPGIKYFSGTATYQNTFELDEVGDGSGILLDLGAVKNIAEVVVNGQNMGVLWKTPYKVDITGAVKAGENSLEVQVTNVWVNRLIGDAQPGVEDEITFMIMPLVTANQELLQSGLLGEVKLSKLAQ
ncbi:MAG: glycoside hydrolase, partial [Gemmatimonadota bacterium]